jgi:hypothetical protein
MALRNLLVRVGADTSGLTRGLNNARSEVKKFGDAITGALGGVKGKIATALAAIAGGEFIKQGIDDATQYEAAMATLGATFGKSTQQFQDWAASTGNAMGFSRLESAKLAQTLSLNFRQIATSQDDLVNKTTKMMEVAALISNKRGMAMTEVSDRIRSAMNAEADGADELGVNVRVAALQQSAAYKQMADGKPWQQLSTATQKQILYSSILEQVTATLGSTIQDTTQLRMAQFTASLGDVRLALGQAFLPILYQILPILNMFMQWLYKALQVFAAFMTALFGGFKFGAGNKQQVAGIQAATNATNQQAGAVNNLGKAHDSTAKKAKAAGKAAQDAAKLGVAGFDEVNTLNFPDKKADAGAGAGGGAGAGAPAMPAMTTPTMPSPDVSGFAEGVNKMVDFFQKKLAPLKAFFMSIWNAISTFFKSKMDEIAKWWAENGQAITKGLTVLWGIIVMVFSFIARFVWESIKGVVDGIIKFFEGFIEFISGIFSGNFKMIWKGLCDMIVGAFLVVWNFLNLTFIGGLRKVFLDLTVDLLTFFVKFGKNILDLFSKNWVDIGKGIKSFIDGMKSFFNDWYNWMYNTGINIAHKVEDAWDSIKSVGSRIANGIKSAFIGIVDWTMRYVITPVVNNFENIKNAFSKGLGSGLRAVINTVATPINDAINGFNALSGAMHLPFRINSRIPTLAEGGIATRATLALVGEGRGPEAIAPIDKLQAYIQNAVSNALGGGATKQGGDIILTIDGRRLARIVKPYLDYENKRIGTNVRLNTI